MSAPGLASMLKDCPFRTVYVPRGSAVATQDFEAFYWPDRKQVPPCDVAYVADAIRTAGDAGRAFYLFFRHRKPRDAMKRALDASGIAAVRGTLQ